MKLNMYSIFDTGSGIYLRPFFMQSDGQATRSFGDIAQDKDHDIGKHPEDYTLFKLGLFDDNTGEIVSWPPEKIATALELVAQRRKVKPGSLVDFDKEVSSNGD